MTPPHTRDSFQSVAEVLKGAVEQSLNAEWGLQSRLHQVVEPDCFAFRKIADLELELAGLLARFVENGPKNVLWTRFQYSLDTNWPREPEDPLQALDHVIHVNQQTVDQLAEQAGKATPESVGDALEMLRKDVEALARKISMIRVTMQDI